MNVRRRAAAFLVALSAVCPGQEATAQQDPATVRLVYNLPVDALQRAMHKQPDMTMEKALAGAVKAVQLRLAGRAKVERNGATSFTVVVPRTTPEELADIKRLVGMIGSLEMRMVASDDYEDTNLNLAKERKRMQQWLADGGRKKLQADAAAIAEFQPLDAKKIRWVVRRIKQNGKRWDYSLTQFPPVNAATVAVFDDKAWNSGSVLPGTDKQAVLLEVVAVNMHEISFTERDLDPAATKVTKDHNNRPAIAYSMRAARRAAYSDLSDKHKGRASAIILNGELVSAPIFLTRIVGNGIISGNFDPKTTEALVTSLQSGALPARPSLGREEALPQKAPPQKGR